MDGFNAEHIFDRRTGYAYDDLIILPGYIDFPVSSINLKSKLTKNIELKTPIIIPQKTLWHLIPGKESYLLDFFDE